MVLCSYFKALNIVEKSELILFQDAVTFHPVSAVPQNPKYLVIVVSSSLNPVSNLLEDWVLIADSGYTLTINIVDGANSVPLPIKQRP